MLKLVQSGAAQSAAIDSKGGKYYVGVSTERKLAAIDTQTMEVIAETPLPGPADIVAFSPKSGLVYVGHDDGSDVWVGTHTVWTGYADGQNSYFLRLR